MVWKEVNEVYVWSTKVRPTTILPWLCFTAEDAGATIALTKTGSPTSVTIETSKNEWSTWSTYTIWDTITLSNVWDKVLFRNASSTTTHFSWNASNNYKFTITWGKAWCSWDVTYLINKDGWVDTIPNNYCFGYLFRDAANLTTPPELPSTTLTTSCYRYMFYWCTGLLTAPKLPATTAASYCYAYMFSGCTSLTAAPVLPATTLNTYCYYYMFRNCSSLTTIPKLPALAMSTYCYNNMFNGCSSVKISSTQTWDYQTAYRIPTSWTGTTASNWSSSMFSGTWWTYTSSPSLNTTYYTSNTVV